MLEKDVRKEIRKIFKEHRPHVVFLANVPSEYTEAGREDFTVCAYGKFMAVEAKKNSQCTLRPSQESRKLDVLAAHGIHLVIHKDNLTLLAAVLNELRRRFLKAQDARQRQSDSGSIAAG